MTVLALAPSCYDDNDDDDDSDFDYHYDYDDDFTVTSASSMAAATRKDATYLASASLAVPLQKARLPENVPLWMRSPRNNDPHHHPTPTITKANNSGNVIYVRHCILYCICMSMCIYIYIYVTNQVSGRNSPTAFGFRQDGVPSVLAFSDCRERFS